MRNRVWYLILALAVISSASTIAAGSKSPKFSRCDGQHRRGANPYGSILPTVDPLTGAPAPASGSTGAGGVDVFPEKPPAAPNIAPKSNRSDGKPQLQVPPISRATPTTVYRSC